MFIAWPQRHWRAIQERHRAKAAQAALQNQISSSKGQSRGGEEKPLLANKKILPFTAEVLQMWLCWPRQWGMPVPVQAVPCRS